jgi:hypothetical protein
VKQDDGAVVDRVQRPLLDGGGAGAGPIAGVIRPEHHHHIRLLRCFDNVRVIVAPGRPEPTRGKSSDLPDRRVGGADLRLNVAGIDPAESDMVVRVVADLVALGHLPAHQCRVQLGLLADHEESCRHFLPLQDVQDTRRELRVRTVIEGEGDLPPRGIAANDLRKAILLLLLVVVPRLDLVGGEIPGRAAERLGRDAGLETGQHCRRQRGDLLVPDGVRDRNGHVGPRSCPQVERKEEGYPRDDHQPVPRPPHLPDSRATPVHRRQFAERRSPSFLPRAACCQLQAARAKAFRGESPRARRIIDRARCSRERTVPIGQASRLATPS